MTIHPLPDTARPCPECDDGFVHWRTCGHTGCCPCRIHEAECEACHGTGAVPCSYCGEGVAVAWVGTDGYCEEHRDETRPSECECDIGHTCDAHHDCSICERPKDSPEPGLCRSCERIAKTMGKRIAAAERFAREEAGHA